MTYAGTITTRDPNLVESFELDGCTAYIVHDTDAEVPDWDGIGAVYLLGYARGWESQAIADYADSGPAAGTLREAWDRFRDSELVARYLRMFHGAVSVDYSDSIDRDAKVWAVVTRKMADAWGSGPEVWAELAPQALNVYRQWAEGSVYGVIVVNGDTGAEASIWGVYDDSPGMTYCRETARELISEVSA